MRRDIALQRLITLLSLSFALYNIVLLVPSASPHIKVISFLSTSQEVTLIIIHFGHGGYQFKKLKSFYYYL